MLDANGPGGWARRLAAEAGPTRQASLNRERPALLIPLRVVFRQRCGHRAVILGDIARRPAPGRIALLMAAEYTMPESKEAYYCLKPGN